MKLYAIILFSFALLQVGVSQNKPDTARGNSQKVSHERNVSPSERRNPREEREAQGNRELDMRIMMKRNEYLTRQLRLTPEEAQKFIPLYNEYLLKEKELKDKSR